MFFGKRVNGWNSCLGQQVPRFWGNWSSSAQYFSNLAQTMECKENCWSFKRENSPVFSLISQRTLKRAGFILWQFRACFLQGKESRGKRERRGITINRPPSEVIPCPPPYNSERDCMFYAYSISGVWHKTTEPCYLEAFFTGAECLSSFILNSYLEKPTWTFNATIFWFCTVEQATATNF